MMARYKIYTEEELKEKKKEWKATANKNFKKKNLSNKKCLNCNNRFIAFLKAKYCSISCSTKMKHKKTKMEKENRKIDYKELWSVFWLNYYKKALKDRQQYLDNFLESYIK